MKTFQLPKRRRLDYYEWSLSLFHSPSWSGVFSEDKTYIRGSFLFYQLVLVSEEFLQSCLASLLHHFQEYSLNFPLYTNTHIQNTLKQTCTTPGVFPDIICWNLDASLQKSLSSITDGKVRWRRHPLQKSSLMSPEDKTTKFLLLDSADHFDRHLV